MTKLAFIDLETTGTDPARHHPWEFGVVIREDGKEKEYEWQVQASLRYADPKALAVGHYYDRRSTMPWSGAWVAPQLANLLAGSVLVGINIWFDRDFTDIWLREHGEALVTDYHMIEICSLVTGYLHGYNYAMSHFSLGNGYQIPKPPARSNDLAKLVGIDPASYERHSALADARYACDIYDKVTTQ